MVGIIIMAGVMVMDGTRLIPICTVEEAQEVEVTPPYIPQTGDQIDLIEL
jgi:hypothetical protein